MPRLSILIPTRDRPDYLLDSVAIALQKCPQAEVIVCDNSSNDDLRSRLATEIANGRVLYDYSSKLLSVVDNFERALKMARGDYLIFIGDDDAIGPGLDEVIAAMAAQGVEAAISYSDAFLANYFWPGVKSKYFGDAYASRLFVHRFDGHTTEVDCHASLRRVAARFGGGLGTMPRAYHGIVARTLLNRIIARHGHVFGGVSPDIYSGALIAAECRKAWFVNYPFVIPGASARSTAGQGAERSDKAALRKTDHIARFGQDLQWDARIPEFYSPQTVWAYSLQKALDRLPELHIEAAYGLLYARCLLYYKDYRAETWRAMRAMGAQKGMGSVLAQTAAGAVHEIATQVRRITLRLMKPRPGGSARSFDRLETISAAYAALCVHIREQAITLKLPQATPAAQPTAKLNEL